jgi:hypothetical protein
VVSAEPLTGGLMNWNYGIRLSGTPERFVMRFFSRGLIDGGWRAPDDWFLRARLADLPAFCELLTREDVPDAIVSELRDLIEMTCV